MNAMNPGLWNCMPQPAIPPPALMAATIPASVQKLARMPAVVEIPSATSLPRDSPACLMRLNSLSESTGSTHGMRFRMIPPTNAKNRRSAMDAAPSWPSKLFLFASTSGEAVPSSFFFKVVEVLPPERLPMRMSTLAGARQMELSQAW